MDLRDHLPLEGHNVVFDVAKLLQVRDAGILLHCWRSAHEGDCGIIRREEVLPNHILVDKANIIRPLDAIRHTVLGRPQMKKDGISVADLASSPYI